MFLVSPRLKRSVAKAAYRSEQEESLQIGQNAPRMFLIVHSAILDARGLRGSLG